MEGPYRKWMGQDGNEQFGLNFKFYILDSLDALFTYSNIEIKRGRKKKRGLKFYKMGLKINSTIHNYIYQYVYVT